MKTKTRFAPGLARLVLSIWVISIVCLVGLLAYLLKRALLLGTDESV